MLFNSFAFALFLPLVFAAYWWVFRRLRAQNAFVLLASWAFYAWWDWRFLGLLLVSTAGDYLFGLRIHTALTTRRRRAWLMASIALNLGLLGIFKYFDFFITGLAGLLRAAGFEPHLPILGILLPVGISFYTFQTLSYTIDIHRRQIAPTHDPVAFAAFISFFPQLVAGPIERARDLLPQFERTRTFEIEQAKDGLRQMLWGFFKKVVVADTSGGLADAVFAMEPGSASSVTLAFGAICFAFQIYGDFSGYSDIAIGCARLFGFNLSRNFAYPYFSRSIGEFWRRWHITLTSWLRDYVYMPLGGWRGKGGRLRNIFITFGVSGLWHGANWTYISWGLLHGAYYIPSVVRNERQRSEHATWRDLPRIIALFGLVTLSWVLFRSATIGDAARYLRAMALNTSVRPWELFDWISLPVWIHVALMLGVEWYSRRDRHGLARLPRMVALRWVIYLVLVALILLHIRLYDEHAFLYFRF